MDFKVGDVVRIGSGRTEYTITWTDDKFPELRSENTGIVRRVSVKRLTIVERKDHELQPLVPRDDRQSR